MPIHAGTRYRMLSDFSGTLAKNYLKDFSCSLLTDPAITTAANSYSPKLNPQENLWNEIRENYSRTMLRHQR
jgi:hypothetical protein